MRKMKNSGINYCGEIPSNWQVMPNKYIFNLSKSIVDNSDNWQLLSLTTKGVKVKAEGDTSGKVPENYNGYQTVKPGDLIMCLFDLDCSAVFSGYSELKGMISPAYKIYNPRSGIANNRYMNYWFTYVFSGRHYKQFSKSLRYTVNTEEFGRLLTVLPPIKEQDKIAEFLDVECKKIDDIINDVNSQILILEDYKKSLITECVTRGLDINTKTKDSGINYIGFIPDHWKTDKGKYIFKYIQKPVKDDDGVITCFRDGEVTLRSNRREDGFTMSEKEIGYQGIDIGDLVVHGMDGFAGAIGISDSRGKASPVLNVLETNYCKKYYMYFLRNMAYRGVFIALSTGIRVRTCDTNWGKLREISYAIPPYEEQVKIADYIEEKCTCLDSVICQKKEQIERLERYKNSLIYEYVTGKKEVPANE